jgi:hypothetical protein
MKILASSIQQAADTFLHAGYISAYPRTLYSYSYGQGSPRMELDVAEALRLQGETLAAGTGGEVTVAAAAVSSSGGWPTMLAGAAALAGAVALLYWLRTRWRGPALRRALSYGAVAMMALAVVGGVHCGPEPLPTDQPWKDVALKSYADPAAATRVLLHGVIADGIENVGQPIDMLENIQNEVGLPAATLTTGQAYALKTYGMDGWGKAFRLSEGGGKYTVTSAGADGAFDTSDDLSVSVVQSEDKTWDANRKTYFVRKGVDGKAVVLFHRWSGEHFVYKHQDKARALTGGDLFDLWTLADLEAKQKTVAQGAYTKAASGKSHEPLVLQVF